MFDNFNKIATFYKTTEHETSENSRNLKFPNP